MSETELKPCPFCGAAPKTIERPDNIDGTEFVYVVVCYCGGYAATAHKMARRKALEQAKKDAIAEWNTRAALAAASAQPVAVPDGWQMVPVDPTKEMKAAAVKFANGPAVYKAVAAAALEIEEGIYGEAYEAMLAAAPQPPAHGIT